MQKADSSETFAFLDREGLSEVPLEKRRLGMPSLQQYRVVHFPSFLKFLRPRVSRKEGWGNLVGVFLSPPFISCSYAPPPRPPDCHCLLLSRSLLLLLFCCGLFLFRHRRLCLLCTLLNSTVQYNTTVKGTRRSRGLTLHEKKSKTKTCLTSRIDFEGQ